MHNGCLNDFWELLLVVGPGQPDGVQSPSAGVWVTYSQRDSGCEIAHWKRGHDSAGVLQCVAVCCSARCSVSRDSAGVLQCVAVCSSAHCSVSHGSAGLCIYEQSVSHICIGMSRMKMQRVIQVKGSRDRWIKAARGGRKEKALQHMRKHWIAAHYNTLQHAATHLYIQAKFMGMTEQQNALMCTATQSNIMQHTIQHCNTTVHASSRHGHDLQGAEDP